MLLQQRQRQTALLHITQKKTTYSTKQCHTLKKEAEKHKKTRENGNRKTSKRAYNPTKEEIHPLTSFAKDAMKKEYRDVKKELANLENMSVSSDKKDEE